MVSPHKVSFCITCKGRLEQLRHTLPINLRNNPDAEFVILDYGSEDGLEQWMKERYRRQITSGSIRYAKVDPQDAPYFKMAHAKNMAHRLATGDIVCNLDADNIAAPGFDRWLCKHFETHPDSYVRASGTTKDMRKLTEALRDVAGRAKTEAYFALSMTSDTPSEELTEKSLRGIAGRIAMTKDNFVRLHGYDETRFQGWGGEDNDLVARSRVAGLKPVTIPYQMLGNVLAHGNEERTKLLSPEDKHVAESLLESERQHKSRSAMRRLQDRIVRKLHKSQEVDPLPSWDNPDGNFGCGRVTVNFCKEEKLEPLKPSGMDKMKESKFGNQVVVAPGRK